MFVLAWKGFSELFIPEYKQLADNIFEGSGVQITSEGERHMGAVIGSENFKELYVTKKVTKWVEDVE